MTFDPEMSMLDPIEALQHAKVPVIIFGAGIVGEVLFHACREAGIPVACFCDNNVNKTRARLCNAEILLPSDVQTRFKDAIFLVSAADLRDVVEQLRALDYARWYASSALLRNYDLSARRFSAPPDFVEYAVDTCLLCHDSYIDPGKLFLRSVDVIITERCSLKCRDCSNLMQYYKKPQNCDLRDVIRSIDSLCSVVDEINEFRVIGGEPFMNRDVHTVVEKLTHEPRVKKIVIYTNGTIVPGEEQIAHFRNGKVLLLITDYGALSRSLLRLTQLLNKSGIAYYTRKAQGWTECAGIRRHGRSQVQQKKVFRECCAKNLATLSDGLLFRCPYSANAARLRAVPNLPGDYIDIVALARSDTGRDEAKKKIRAFLLDKTSLDTCDYCNGRPLGAPEIQPAIQLSAPLEYEPLR